MKASDLRIGNLLMYNSPVSLTSEMIELNIYHLSDILGETVLSCSDRKNAYEPIPLNKEWLLNFGFEQRNSITILIKTIQYHNENYPVTLQFTNNGTAMQIARSGIGSACAPCEHVHQLQNLYFALTGQELELTK